MTSDKIYKRKFLVVDDAHLLETHQLKRTVNPAIKTPEPVLKMDAPWNQDGEMFNHVFVVRDEPAGLFRMWYVVYRATGREGEVISEGGVKLAYATSVDGLRWERPKLNLVETNGSRENNYVTPEMGMYGCTILCDPSDIPARRYKMIFGIHSKETQWADFHIPLSLAYSADGIIWDRPAHVNPVLRGISDGELALFYDADRRKYILLTRRVPNLPRDISQYESNDLVNWEDMGRVLVPGDEYDPPEMYNVYYLAPFRYEEFHLGMLSAQYTHPLNESYESFHQSPGYPHDKLGHVDIQLAFTRDTQHWHRPLDRSPVVGCGSPGEPDFGGIYPAQNPVVVDGETYIYYTADRNLHCWWHEWEQNARGRLPRDRCCCMLARMPEDHWVSLDAGPAEGWFMTKPWLMGLELLVNADARNGAIEAEYITPYGEPIPGFTRADCVPVTGDGKDQPLRWKHGRSGWDLMERYRGNVLAKFYLKNAKLYSYTVTEPDPDGVVGRYWANARWLEHIKHRSDNWGAKNNAPATGLSPYDGPKITA